MSSLGFPQKLIWTLVASGALIRNSTLPVASIRGYSASQTLVDAGANPSELCAQHRVDNRSIAIPILFIQFLHPVPNDWRGEAVQNGSNTSPGNRIPFSDACARQRRNSPTEEVRLTRTRGQNCPTRSANRIQTKSTE